ncbi:uncharacterized protein C8Q71DRAFT_224381 [Rhodofomes roseus]|uniref:Uncharacterized protein n=1 Tax=Rhodofomes roseus TaxID=34475 RepID=A0A4Y9YFD9_9APHY|nr:uncharacterized protein C8Q71DRAFT_224381 [Rhodofomes roseus]KAH9842852.1 hypothetical protein C8Q71DRAFT_224381 [Rhodofomes roseus]TFY60710.1 hypothetical protein EVJ58_g4980 [Rhodofomes roseus]
MSRLASFKGPSTPTSSPVRAKEPTTPSSPSRLAESTYHRKVRTLLQEMRTVTDTWEDIVIFDGLKAVKSLVDARTDLDNVLASERSTQPNRHLVGETLSAMEDDIVNLSVAIEKLKKQFQRMNIIIDNLEGVLVEAHKTKGWRFVQEPLWVSWSLEKFVTAIPDILAPYHRSLLMHEELARVLRSHDATFEASRQALAEWAAQPYLEDHSWETEWEDLCAAEIDRWNGPK